MKTNNSLESQIETETKVKMMNENEILSKIKSAQNIALLAHENPDPDAYGSLFAMKEICKSFGKNAEIVAVKNREGYLDRLFPLEEVKEDFVPQNYDLVILLDCHLVHRVANAYVEKLSEFKNMIVIDHHKVESYDVLPSENVYIKDDYAANCQILTDLAICWNVEITPKMATFLYAGLIGDTDRFLHKNLTRHVFETGIFLYDKKADVQFVYDYLYRYKTKAQMEIYKTLLNKLVYLENGRCAFVIFTLKDLKKMNADQEDIKVYSDDIVKIKDVELSFICTEYEKDFFKFSLRSNGANTLKVSAKMGGGGHVCASGFEMKISAKNLHKMLEKWAKEILND